MGKSSKKSPKHQSLPSSTKKPRKDPSLPESLNVTPVWQAGIIDLNGPWGWMEISHRVFLDNILPKLQHFESMSWHEILGRNNHEVEVEKISKKAQKRLTDLKLDDYETLVSLRLTGPQRVWGIKMQNIFKILWWDPNHEVYPSTLKNT
ncbi:MAG: hypothetical protein AB7S75_04770 [Desulfococcaceae bacterium]